MSPNDEYFLKALGIKPEEIAPSSRPQPGYAAAFGLCPSCSARRHRDLTTGEVFCLSCRARKARDAANTKLELWPAQSFLPVFYRGFQVAELEGQGWSYRHPSEWRWGHWRPADSLQDAMKKIEQLVGPEPTDEPDFVRVENACRGCGAPCGDRDWCRSCGREKFGDHS